MTLDTATERNTSAPANPGSHPGLAAPLTQAGATSRAEQERLRSAYEEELEHIATLGYN